MSYFRFLSDHVRACEWQCLVCGCISDADQRLCWNCHANTDGDHLGLHASQTATNEAERTEP